MKHILLFLLIVSSFIFGPIQVEAATLNSNNASSSIGIKGKESQNEVQRLTDEIKILNEKIKLQDEIIEKVDKKSTDSVSSFNFPTWAGIILSAVSVIITVLGLFIAIFSFFGYKKIIEIVENKSFEVAQEEAKKIAIELTPVETEKMLIKLIEDHRFDAIINDSVSKFMYRGIQSYGTIINSEDEK